MGRRRPRALAAGLAAAAAIFPAAAWACRCDFGPVRALEADPAGAETAFIAKAESPGGRQALRVDVAWTQAPGIVFLAPSKCAVRVEDGKRYLVFSFNTAEFIESRKLGLTICDTVVKELPKAGPFLKKLAKKRRAAPTMADPAWYLCSKSADCVTAKDACGGPSAVNRAKLKEHEERERKLAPMIRCAPPPKEPFPASVCSQGLCVLKGS